SEAKGTGFDTKVMRQIVRLRKMEDADRQEMQAILDTYKKALGLDD
ncbi:MAG TPA: GapR family DNA-binding domain-containing protein, partial [Dongiaceae bacterium]